MPHQTAAEWKAKMAASLCPSLLKSLFEMDLDKVTDKIVALNNLLDRIATAYVRKDSGLVIYVRKGRYNDVPSAVLFAASYVEEDLDMRAYVHKSRDGVVGPLENSTREGLIRGEWLPPDPTLYRPTWYEHLTTNEQD